MCQWLLKLQLVLPSQTLHTWRYCSTLWPITKLNSLVTITAILAVFLVTVLQFSNELCFPSVSFLFFVVALCLCLGCDLLLAPFFTSLKCLCGPHITCYKCPSHCNTCCSSSKHSVIVDDDWWSYPSQRLVLHLLMLQTVKNALVKERDRLFLKLQEFPFLQPYPSHANFILCSVTGAKSAKQLKVCLCFLFCNPDFCIQFICYW